MGPLATSFQVRTPSPSRAAAALAAAAEQVRNPTAAIVFVSGKLAERIDFVATSLGELRAPFPIAVAGGAGVLTERTEVEDEAAIAGLTWSGGRAEVVPIPVSDSEDQGEGLARLLSDRTSKTAPTAIVFGGADALGSSNLSGLRDGRGTPYMFGGGTVGEPGSAAIGPGGEVHLGPVALILRGMAPPSIRTSHCCRLLGPLRPITETRGALVLSIDGVPALDLLAEHGQNLVDRPLLLTVLAEPETGDSTHSARPELIVRGLRGVDPARRALVVSDEVREGMRMAFAVRDAKTARDDLEAVTRELLRDIAGAAPRFGLYINCAGRGAALYGSHDVDTRILKARFGDIPIAGMQSSFEIAPHLGRPTVQLYTGVFGLFTAPS